MNLGARTAAWSGGKLSAKSYVQDGLIAMWDGIENAGWGTHDASATTWKDLIGSNDITMTSLASFESDSVSINGYLALPAQISSAKTLEIVFKRDTSGSLSYIFCASTGVGPYTSWGRCFLFQEKGNELAFGAGAVWSSLNYPNSTKVDTTKRISFSGTLSDTLTSNYLLPTTFRICDNDMNLTAGDYYGTNIVYGFGSSSSSKYFNGEVCCVRLYSTDLSDEKRTANYAVDKARFGLT